LAAAAAQSCARGAVLQNVKWGKTWASSIASAKITKLLSVRQRGIGRRRAFFAKWWTFFGMSPNRL
jgi:hypothetical protein